MDEEGQPISRGKKKRTVVHTDKALQEAQDVFGVDFDFTEFEEYGSDYEDEEEEEVRMILYTWSCDGGVGSMQSSMVPYLVIIGLEDLNMYSIMTWFEHSFYSLPRMGV